MKKINSKTVLAIIGAIPTFEEQLHVGQVYLGQLIKKIFLNEAMYASPAKFSLKITNIKDVYLIRTALLQFTDSSIRFQKK